MHLSSGLPFSLIKNGLPFDYPKLRESITTDVVIMGGGISGALMAYYFIKNGIKCILIDKRTIGLGSSCASTSLLQYEIDVPLHILKKQIGAQQAISAYKLCSDSIIKLEHISKIIGFKDFEFKNSLYFAAKPSHKKDLEQEYAARKGSGFKVKWLTKKDIQQAYGFTSPAAILSYNGAQTNAYLFTHHLLQYCIKKGVRVFDRTEAVKISHQKNGIVLKTIGGPVLKAKKLVYAVGYEAVSYIDKKIVSLNSTYVTISEQMTTPFLRGKSNTMLWNTSDPYLYIRTEGNRILVGGRDRKDYVPKSEDKHIKEKTRQLTNDFHHLFPHQIFKPEFSWSGIFGTTQDGLPFIGNYPKLPHSYFALGFGGNGITFSQIAAELITKDFMGKTNKDIQLFSFNRI